MPGDVLNNIQYLDVQFGGLDFGTEESFDSLSEKFNQNSMEPPQTVQNTDVTIEFQVKSTPSSNVSGSNVNSTTGLSSSQIENRTSSFSQRTNSQQSGSLNNNVINNITSSNNGLDQLNKVEHFNQVNSTASSVYQTVSSYSGSGTKPNIYQSSQSSQAYPNYSGSQTQSNIAYSQSTNAYNAYNTPSVNSYQQQSTANSNNVVTNNVIPPSNTNSAQNIPVNNTVNSR